jgi:hypothetical protein
LKNARYIGGRFYFTPMTKRQIILARKKIDKSKNEGYHLDALIKNYHLNLEILKYISLNLNPGLPSKNLKPKQILNALITEIKKHPDSKFISKKSLKPLKPWLVKMDAYFKILKNKPPVNTTILFAETEKIFNLLYISFTKMLSAK